MSTTLNRIRLTVGWMLLTISAILLALHVGGAPQNLTLIILGLIAGLCAVAQAGRGHR